MKTGDQLGWKVEWIKEGWEKMVKTFAVLLISWSTNHFLWTPFQNRARIIFSEIISENLVSSSNSYGIWGSAVSSSIESLGRKYYSNTRKQCTV